jgi:hypothetical protein
MGIGRSAAVAIEAPRKLRDASLAADLSGVDSDFDDELF